MKKRWLQVVIVGLMALWPGLIHAAGGTATDIVVVADTRHLTGFTHYIANLYNENMWLFAVWSVVLTTALGASLGVIMDIIMSRTGLDLGKTRKHEQ